MYNTTTVFSFTSIWHSKRSQTASCHGILGWGLQGVISIEREGPGVSSSHWTRLSMLWVGKEWKEISGDCLEFSQTQSTIQEARVSPPTWCYNSSLISVCSRQHYCRWFYLIMSHLDEGTGKTRVHKSNCEICLRRILSRHAILNTCGNTVYIMWD